MGGGYYNTFSASTRARTLRKSYDDGEITREDVFKQRRLIKEMNIKGRIRECRDSNEHPNAYPIILGLDVTGSMGFIPENLLKEGFPIIMDKILNEGIKDPQVCFLGIGDYECGDEAPIQCGEFESSDELTEKWLKNLYLEGGGGGNSCESYNLAWYFGGFKTSIDINEKHSKRGTLITIGDEPLNNGITKSSASHLFGDTLETSSMTNDDIYKAASKLWDIYHIVIPTGTSRYLMEQIKSSFGKYLDEDHLLFSESSNSDAIVDVVKRAIMESYSKQFEKFSGFSTTNIITD